MLYPNLLPARRRLNRLSFLLLLLASSIVWSSCKKVLSPAEFTLKGRLLQDCSGKPIANVKMYLTNSDPGLVQGTRKELGQGITDEQGYFEFKCIRSSSFINLYSDGEHISSRRLINYKADLPENGGVLNVGTLYRYGVYRAPVRLDINRVTNPTDTLFVVGSMHLDGQMGTELIAINPIPASITIALEWAFGHTDSLVTPEKHMEVYWGIGRQEFNSRQHKAPAKAYICQSSDTSVVVID